MKGILILAHGSKRLETERIVNSLVEKVKSKTGETLVYPAFLQFSDQNLEKGVDYLVKEGADHIRIMPMFLFDGVHVTQDIPNELETIKARYPGVEIKMAAHIGDDDRIADIIVDRVNSI
ncbi:MAG: CbiX/SirB N-terminal domain-containing protein [Clostridiales bacterium]|jgi:sirohydrochlorin ferrochelatase|nr:CbiX/SirB N-terminal domain-containing protein [Eubacteriales bacterium]MDH7565738.1 CbiX/SirB N-terminal domain-containing protein [Clostridiales bacterium]